VLNKGGILLIRRKKRIARTKETRWKKSMCKKVPHYLLFMQLAPKAYDSKSGKWHISPHSYSFPMPW
jgi:hypothetical protein